jgi:hypothetical protein
VVEKQGKPTDYAIVPPLKMKGVNEKMSWGVRIWWILSGTTEVVTTIEAQSTGVFNITILIESVLILAELCSGYAVIVRIYGELVIRLGFEEGPITTSTEVSGVRKVKEAKDGVVTAVPVLSVNA